MKALKIAHLTDLHLRYYTPGSSYKHKNRSRDILTVLSRALDMLKKEKVDILVITGDIVDCPGIVLKYNDYYMDLASPFRKQIRKDYLTIRSVLDKSGIPWIVIPGNKDKTDLFLEIWGDQKLIRDIKGYRFVSFYDRQWDSSQPRRIDRERRLMEKVLNDPDSPPQIHLQHFLSTPNDAVKIKHFYKEADNIRKMCTDSGKVVLSLSGHYHPGIKKFTEGPTSWISAPAFSALPHPFLIHELEAGMLKNSKRVELFKKSPHAHKPVVFLDRDGVIITLPSYTTGPEEMELIPGAAEAIQKLKDAGFAVVINTNQSCIGLGYVPESVVLMNNEYMSYLLTQETGNPESQADAIYFSKGAGKDAVHSDYKDVSDVKPAPYFLNKAFSLLGLNRKKAWMVGDREGDILCAENARIKAILVRSGDGKNTEKKISLKKHKDLIIKNDLKEAVEFIINNTKNEK